MTFFSSKKLCIGLGMLAGAALFASILFGIFAPLNKKSSAEVIFSVQKGEGSGTIGHALAAQGLIRSSALFKAYTLATRTSLELQAGDYLLSPRMSLFAIAQKLAQGDSMQKTFTIIEGWDIKDIENYFAKMGRIIKISPNLEGYLFPDTYHIGTSASNEEIIDMMRTNFEKKFNDDFDNHNLLWETIQQGKTIDQIVTMASLLEKELQTKEDKAIAGGILWKRLGIGMALQVDAEPNTYKERGLPARPIANPGLESIKAALYPIESPYWYYLSTPEGKTIFSKTLEEHNIAKAKYLLK